MSRITAVVVLCAATLLAQEPTLREMLRRVHTYVTQFEDHVLSGMVSDESYLQQVIAPDGSVKEQRRLVSEYVILQIPPDEAWYGFRNVVEVDGKPLPDRSRRLEQVFTSRRSHQVEDAMQLAAESARFNIGMVYRTVNLPTFVLSFLRPSNRDQLEFEAVGRENVAGTVTWIVAYRDKKHSSFIETPTGRQLRTQGRFWADPSTGRVVRTELEVGPDRNTPWKGRIVVDYRYELGHDAWLPSEMHEMYENPRSPRAGRVTGEATYTNYRRLDIKRSATQEPGRAPEFASGPH